jgi:hypothetical protein
MSKSAVMENDLLKLIFNNVAAAGIGDTNGLLPSATAGVFWVSLHTADPGNAGNQSTSETAYTGYARVAVARTTSGFTVTNSSVRFTDNVDFGTCTANPGAAITHFGIGDSQTGAGKLRYSGTLTPNIELSINGIPRVDTSANLITED